MFCPAYSYCIRMCTEAPWEVQGRGRILTEKQNFCSLQRGGSFLALKFLHPTSTSDFTHSNLKHYINWRTTVLPYVIAKPERGIAFNVIFSWVPFLRLKYGIGSHWTHHFVRYCFHTCMHPHIQKKLSEDYWTYKKPSLKMYLRHKYIYIISQVFNPAE